MTFLAFKRILHLFELKRLLRVIFLSLSVLAVILLLIDAGIRFYVHSDIYEDIDQIPHRPYGVVLGTSKYFTKNTLNLFYYNRLLATYRLFSKGKVDYLLLSGDNRTLQYNEPRTMFRDLRKMGVPETFMYFDYAGFRTLDSVIRAKEIFQAVPMTIISQKFHCERALFIAKYYGVDAICYAADYPDGYTFVRLREFFARLKVILDLLIEKEPYFLGKPEPLPSPLTIPVVKDDI